VIGQGVWILWGSNIAISHWQSQSPLTQGWRYRAARDKLTPSSLFFCLPPTLSVAHLAPCLTLTGRPCFYSRQSFEIFLLCSVQVTEFQLEYLMHACSSDFVHYWNTKLSPSLIHQTRIQGVNQGAMTPPQPQWDWSSDFRPIRAASNGIPRF